MASLSSFYFPVEGLMANREERDWALRHGGNRVPATRCFVLRIRLAVLSCVLCAPALPAAGAGESHAAKDVSRRVRLDGPGNAEPMLCDVVQVLDSSGEPRAYFMDVDSVVCTDTKCESVTVRLHFDALGSYERYELPSGGNLTKSGGKPFSPADHERLHQILSDPYSPLKSIGLKEIAAPKNSAAAGGGVDAVSRPTVLSKQSAVVAGAAYTCCTLWHWSHGEVGSVIRDMTIRACDKQDLLRYLRSDKDTYVAFAAEQLRMQDLFDAETIAAVVEVMRHGSAKVLNPALDYLAKASSKTGVDHFFCCCDDEYLVADSIKRARFLEALRETDQELPSGYLDRLVGWLTRADSYYEVHLLLTLRERENASSEEAVDEAISLLESDDALVVRRSYGYLKALKLSDLQQQKLEAFEREHPEGY
jgi:hypothetical protein